MVMCSQQWAHQTESSGRSCAIIIFRFPGLISPQSWTQGAGRSPSADTDISVGHVFIPRFSEWKPWVSPSSVMLYSVYRFIF